MEKLLKDFIRDAGGKKIRVMTQEEDEERVAPEQRTIPVQKLVLKREGSIRYNVPAAPITSPDHCLEIFRTHFRGADKEIVAILSLSTNKEFLNVANVAWGTINHVVVHPREVFKHALSRDNAAFFIVAHNHPSGDPTPSEEDFAMLEDLRDLGRRLACPMQDFLILGDGTNLYYSHRELHYDMG